MTNPLSKFTLRLTVPLLLVIPVLITAVALISIGLSGGRAASTRLADENLTEIHREITSRVERLLDIPAQINRVDEVLIQEGRLATSDVRQWRATLFAELQDTAGLSSIIWGNETGQAVNVARYVGDDNFTLFVKDDSTGGLMEEFALNDRGEIVGNLGTITFDTHERPWYKAAIKADKGVWGEPYVWIPKVNAPQPTLGISYSQPCFSKDGKLLGAIATELSLNDISQFLSRLKIGKTGLAFIMYGDGRMVASSTSSPVIDKSGQLIAAWNSADGRIACAAGQLRNSLGIMASPDNQIHKVVEIAGQRYLLVVSSLNHKTGLKWLIVTVVPESDFLAEVQAGRIMSFFVAAGIALLAVLLGVLLGVSLTRPIMSLVAYVRRIGAGDLNGKLSLQQSPELRELSQEINTMTAGLQDRMRIRHSLAMAMEVQQNLLPHRTPKINGLDLTGHSTYCDETGGDYYDFIDAVDLSDSAVTVAIGDVSGHGIASAMVMAEARGVLRSRCHQTGTLAEMLTHMNDLLEADLGDGKFMTMLLVTLDAQRRQMRWASAGHDMPFVYDPVGERFIDIDGAGLPLGMMPEQTYEEYSLPDLPPGAIILAATDGVWEMANSNGELFDKERVRQVIRRSANLTSEQISKCLQQALADFRGQAEQRDDVTFVVAKMA